MADTCLHGRTEHFHENKQDSYKENLPKIPQVVLDELGIKDVAELRWFDDTVMSHGPLSVCDEPFFGLVSEPRGRSALAVFENLHRPDDKRRFMVVWAWYDSWRVVNNPSNRWHRDYTDCKYIKTVLLTGMSKSGAQKKARELQKLIDAAKKMDHENRTLREFGAPCRGKIGRTKDDQTPCRIGDLVKYDNGGKDCGWLYQIVAETESPNANRGAEPFLYKYRISAVFTGFRGLKQPPDETVSNYRIRPVELTELCKTFADLRDLIDAHLKQNGVKPLGS